ncbi:Crp/Fnr family transcriptional regulator [Virgibacillus oceani]
MEYLYIVHLGRVKNYQLFESGKEQLFLRIVEPGESMGELLLYTEKTYAEAMEKTQICAIYRDDMQGLMRTHNSIAVKILEQFSNRLDDTERLVGQLSSKDVEMRTISHLLRLAGEKESPEIVLAMRKKDLASYLGTAQETISRRPSNFQTNGWIELKGHWNIKILDRESISELATG